MDFLTAENLHSSMRLTGVQLPEERLGTIAHALNQVLETLQPLDQLNLPKDFEPTTYLMFVLGRLKD